MKIKRILLPVIVIGAIVLGLKAEVKQIKKQPNSRQTGGFAVVELFTSEGCSSCPPADALIAKIEKEQADQPIYILAYHVDYWDKLGWRDPFSNPKFSARQRQYANWLNLSTIYTPQIVVNGSHEFTGSEENTLRKSIQTARSKSIKNKLELSLIKSSSAELNLKYSTSKNTENNILFIALVNPNASSLVLKGENKGRMLNHVQIVTEIENINLDGRTNGTVHINFPKTSDRSKATLIAFLQNNKTGEITAVSRINNLTSAI
ncbi:DUF1223 domain-containing protein [Pedobacter sp. UYP1]|uniref:DUF1223 domain-containing protein n=1 Tax=Pedobacter sp. UYP1 TaxID=1756396 RepID=UPI0033929CA5